MSDTKKPEIKLLDFIDEACELLNRLSKFNEIRIKGEITNIVITKPIKEDDSKGVKREVNK